MKLCAQHCEYVTCDLLMCINVNTITLIKVVQLICITLDSNGIFGVLPDCYGNGAEPDKFAAEAQPLLDALKTSSVSSLSLKARCVD